MASMIHIAQPLWLYVALAERPLHADKWCPVLSGGPGGTDTNRVITPGLDFLDVFVLTGEAIFGVGVGYQMLEGCGRL